MTDKEKQERRKRIKEKTDKAMKEAKFLVPFYSLEAKERDKFIALFQIANNKSGKVRAYFFSDDGKDLEPTIFSHKGFFLRTKWQGQFAWGWALFNPDYTEDADTPETETSAQACVIGEWETQILKKVGLYELMNKNMITVRKISPLQSDTGGGPYFQSVSEEHIGDTYSYDDLCETYYGGGFMGYRIELTLNLPEENYGLRKRV